MYLEYVVNQPEVIQEMENQAPIVERELEYFDSYIETEVMNNLDKLFGDDIIETYNNIREFSCQKTIEFIEAVAEKFSK